MKQGDPWNLVLGAWVVSLIATLGSLRYSGIGFLGLEGLGLPPCEMCWYQRILMYPLTGILAHAYWTRSRSSARIGLAMAVPGALLAAYHSLIQYLPHLEAGQCSVGSCSAILYRSWGLTIPNQSLVAFLLIAGVLGMREWAARAATTGPDGV